MLDAVIVTYRSAQLIGACLEGLVAAGCERIIVVDNSPDAETFDVTGRLIAEHPAWPDITVLRRADNPGFSAAINAASQSLRPGADLLLVNPDVIVPAGSLGALSKRLVDDPSLGAVAATMRLQDGKLGISGGPFPTALKEFLSVTRLHQVVPRSTLERVVGNLSRKFPTALARYDYWNHGVDTDTREVDWASGFFLLVRREAWESVRGFPPGFFMYFEDVALSRLLRDAGWKVAVATDVFVSHLESASSGGGLAKRRLYVRGLRDYVRWTRLGRPRS